MSIKIYLLTDDPFHPATGLIASGADLNSPDLHEVQKEATVRQLEKHPTIYIRVSSINIPAVTGNRYQISNVRVVMTDNDGKFLRKPVLHDHLFVRSLGENPETFLSVIVNYLRDTVSLDDPNEVFNKSNTDLESNDAFNRLSQLSFQYVPWERKEFTDALSKTINEWPEFS